MHQDIARVLASWDRMVENKPFEDKPTKRFATSYMEGLQAKPWHNVERWAVIARSNDIFMLLS
jgi:hypothetical protein